MFNGLPEMYVVIEGSKFLCVVTDTEVHLGFPGGDLEKIFLPISTIPFRPFETAAQALQRGFPGCQIYVGNLLVNAPGNREWIA